MRLDPPPKHAMRVHELAKELGWPPARLVDELRRRGEWVKSAMSTIEAPVVRAIRRDFAAADPPANPEHSLEPGLYGDSADLALPTEPPGETFAQALARVKAEPHSTRSPRRRRPAGGVRRSCRRCSMRSSHNVLSTFTPTGCASGGS